jgi:TetR/AcrR family transcriptional repressor of nem operon
MRSALALPRRETVPPSQDSKTRFLEAALRVIRTKGYEATTVDELCAAAGLTKGSFFHHFKSKEDLALAAAQHFADRAERLFADAPYRGLADPRARLLAYIDHRRALLTGEVPDFTCLLGTMVQETFDTHPALRSACERHLGAHVDILVKDIAEAKRRYAPRARWSAESLGVHIQATLQGAFIFAKARQGPQAVDECLAHLRRYLAMLLPSPTLEE